MAKHRLLVQSIRDLACQAEDRLKALESRMAEGREGRAYAVRITRADPTRLPLPELERQHTNLTNTLARVRNDLARALADPT